MQKKTLTIKMAISFGSELLSKKKISTASLDTQILLSHALKIKRVDLYKDFYRRLTVRENRVFLNFLRRRSLFEPVSYIRGIKEFYSKEFKVSKAVLAPRPETELLVDQVLQSLSGFKKDKRIKILDLGTGSGAISIAVLANTRRKIDLTASDLSVEALKIAKENAKMHSFAKKVKFVRSNLFKSIKKRFDMIVSNPPYVETKEVLKLIKKRIDYEPRIALDGGKDGLDLIRIIIKEGIDYLEQDGLLLMEIGYGQSEKIRKFESCTSYRELKFLKDLSEKERVVYLRK